MSIGLSAGINGFVEGMQAGQRWKDAREEREWRREDREWQRETRAEDRDWRREQREWAVDDREWTVAERERLAAERKSDRGWTQAQRDRQRELWTRQDTTWEREEAERAEAERLEAEERRLWEMYGRQGRSAPGLGPVGPRADQGGDGERETPQYGPRVDQVDRMPADAPRPGDRDYRGGTPFIEPGQDGPRAPSNLNSSAPGRSGGAPEPTPASYGPRVDSLPDGGQPVGPRRAAGSQPDQGNRQPEGPPPPPESPEGQPETDGYTGPTLMGDLRAGFEQSGRMATGAVDSVLGLGPAIWNNSRGAIEAAGEYVTGRDLDVPEVQGVTTEGMFGNATVTERDAQDPDAPSRRPADTMRAPRSEGESEAKPGPGNSNATPGAYMREAINGRGPDRGKAYSDYMRQTRGYGIEPFVAVPQRYEDRLVDSPNWEYQAPASEQPREASEPAPQRPSDPGMAGAPAGTRPAPADRRPEREQPAPRPQASQMQPTPASATRGEPDAMTAAAAETDTPTTRSGTPAASASTIRRMSQSMGLGGDVPSEEQRERGAQEFQRHYDEDVAPKLIDFYMRNGMPEKAEAFRTYLKDEQVRRGRGHWSRAIMAASIGDEKEFIHQLSSAYNTDGYYDDGLTIDPKATRFIRNGEDVTGAEITFINDRTGERFIRQYKDEDLFRLGINSLSFESAFENNFERFQAGRTARQEAQPSNKDILDAMDLLGDQSRGPQAAEFNALSPAEQRRVVVDFLTGAPGLGGAMGSSDVPLLGARD